MPDDTKPVAAAPRPVDCPAILYRDHPAPAWMDAAIMMSEWAIGREKREDKRFGPLRPDRPYAYAARLAGKVSTILLNWETPVASRRSALPAEVRKDDAIALSTMIWAIRLALPGVQIVTYGVRPNWGLDRPGVDGVGDYFREYAQQPFQPDAWGVSGYIYRDSDYKNLPLLFQRIDRDVAGSQEVLRLSGLDARVAVVTSPRCYFGPDAHPAIARRALMVDHPGMMRRQWISRALRDRGIQEVHWYENRDASRIIPTFRELDPTDAG